MMDHGHILETKQPSQNGYAADRVIRSPSTGVAENAAAEVRPKELLGDASGVKTGHWRPSGQFNIMCILSN